MSREESASYPPVPTGAKMTNIGPDLALIELPSPEAELPSSLSEAERGVAVAVFDGASNERIVLRLLRVPHT